MKLIDSIPFTLPNQKRGIFQDNFAATGAANVEHRVSGGTISRLFTGISLNATTLINSDLFISQSANSKDFEAEVLVRNLGITFDLRPLIFRYLSSAERNFIRIDTAGVITLRKTVANVSTIVATGTKTCIQNKFNKIGVRAYGANVEVFLNDVRIINAQEPAQKNNSRFVLQVVGSAVGTAKGEWSYLSIRAL